jgi:hypothetical protein
MQQKAAEEQAVKEATRKVPPPHALLSFPHQLSQGWIGLCFGLLTRYDVYRKRLLERPPHPCRPPLPLLISWRPSRTTGGSGVHVPHSSSCLSRGCVRWGSPLSRLVVLVC